jgi:hypothetical protein
MEERLNAGVNVKLYPDEPDTSFSTTNSSIPLGERYLYVEGNAGIDQAILDDIGVESSDSEGADDDYLPVPSLYTQKRNSLKTRSKSMGCFNTFVQDEFHLNGQFCERNVVMPSPKRFATGIEPQQVAPSLGSGLSRSVSMPRIEKSRSGYNRAVGEAIANSPKKGAMNTSEDLAMIEKLLSDV